MVSHKFLIMYWFKFLVVPLIGWIPSSCPTVHRCFILLHPVNYWIRLNFSVHLLYLSTLWFMFGTSLHILPLLIFSFFSCIFFPSDLCEQFYDCHFELFSMEITYPHFIKFCFWGFILSLHLAHIPISSFSLTFCVDFCTLDKTTISPSLEWSGLVYKYEILISLAWAYGFLSNFCVCPSFLYCS